MKDALKGLNILVTRPSDAGEMLCQMIEKEGGRAIFLPTIAFAEPSDIETLKADIAALDQQEWLIFNSPQAVKASLPYIQSMWKTLPSHIQIAAVGEGTARALKESGMPAAIYPKEEWSTEGILDLDIFKQAQGKKIAIITGEGGRKLLQETLIARGARVTMIYAYRRILPKADIAECVELLNRQALHAIIGLSFETIANLKTLLGPGHWFYLARTPLIVGSQRIKTLAEDSGFQTIWVSQQMNNQSVLDLLIQRRNDLCQTPS